MNLTTLDSFLWIADFALSTLALWIVFTRHRQIWPLWSLLAWRSLANAAEFAAMSNPALYNRIYYVSSCLEVLGEIALAAFLCGELVRERRRDAGIFAGGIALAGAFAFLARHHGVLDVTAILRTESTAVGALGLLLILGWIGRLEVQAVKLPEPYRGILAGTIALIAVQSVAFGLLHKFGGEHWAIISRVQPVGELLVLASWCWAAWRPVRLAEVRTYAKVMPTK